MWNRNLHHIFPSLALVGLDIFIIHWHRKTIYVSIAQANKWLHGTCFNNNLFSPLFTYGSSCIMQHQQQPQQRWKKRESRTLHRVYLIPVTHDKVKCWLPDAMQKPNVFIEILFQYFRRTSALEFCMNELHTTKKTKSEKMNTNT